MMHEAPTPSPTHPTPTARAPHVTTLLRLVQAVQDCTDDDEEVVAVITHLVETGRVRLGGIFAGSRIRFAV